jgi:hypothetical protein
MDAGWMCLLQPPLLVTTPVNPDITDVTVSQTINCNGNNTVALAITIDAKVLPFVILLSILHAA